MSCTSSVKNIVENESTKLTKEQPLAWGAVQLATNKKKLSSQKDSNNSKRTLYIGRQMFSQAIVTQLANTRGMNSTNLIETAKRWTTGILCS